MFRSLINVFSKTTIRKWPRKASLEVWKTAWKRLWRSTFLQICFSRNHWRSQDIIWNTAFYEIFYEILLSSCLNFLSFGFLFVWSVSAKEANKMRHLSCNTIYFYANLSFGSKEFLLSYVSCLSYFDQIVPQNSEKKINRNWPSQWCIFGDEIFLLSFISQ